MGPVGDERLAHVKSNMIGQFALGFCQILLLTLFEQSNSCSCFGFKFQSICFGCLFFFKGYGG
jgi:hypothetical protein